MTLVFGFPTGWAILTALGAALLASTGVATLIDRARQRGERGGGQPVLGVSEEKAELRRAASDVLEDIERIRVRAEDTLEDGRWWGSVKDHPLFDIMGWTERGGDVLAAQGHQDVHRLVREAIRQGDNAVLRRDAAWKAATVHNEGDPPTMPGGRPELTDADMDVLESLVAACKAAEDALDEVQR